MVVVRCWRRRRTNFGVSAHGGALPDQRRGRRSGPFRLRSTRPARKRRSRPRVGPLRHRLLPGDGGDLSDARPTTATPYPGRASASPRRSPSGSPPSSRSSRGAAGAAGRAGADESVQEAGEALRKRLEEVARQLLKGEDLDWQERKELDTALEDLGAHRRKDGGGPSRSSTRAARPARSGRGWMASKPSRS